MDVGDAVLGVGILYAPWLVEIGSESAEVECGTARLWLGEGRSARPLGRGGPRPYGIGLFGHFGVSFEDVSWSSKRKARWAVAMAVAVSTYLSRCSKASWASARVLV